MLINRIIPESIGLQLQHISKVIFIRNRETKDSLRNIKVQCDEIAHSFARISLEVGKLVHEESESESEADDKFNSTNSATKTDTEGVIRQQIAVATKIKEEIKSIKESYKDNVKPIKELRDQQLGPFKKGEKLIITNNYLGLQGTEGIVLHSNRKYTVIIDNNKTPHKRIHRNFRRVNE